MNHLSKIDLQWEWLVGSSIKVVAWLAFVLIMLWFVRRASASWRHVLAVVGAVGIPLIFFLNLTLIPDRIGWRPFAGAAREAVELKAETRVQFGMVSEPNLAPVTGQVPTANIRNDRSADIQTGIVWLWWLGCLVVGMRLLIRLRRPQLSELSPAPAELLDALHHECASMNMLNPPDLRTAPEAMPMVCGMRQATVILPSAAVDWTPEKLSSILRHELAHIQRRDVWWSIVVEAMLLPVWWLPLARILRRKAAEWTEQACDDAVISSGIVPTQYATDLLSVSRRAGIVPSSIPGLGATNGQGQEDRFRRLLDAEATRTAVSFRKAVGTGLSALCLLLPATLLVSCSTVSRNEAAPKSAGEGFWNFPVASNATNSIRLTVKFFDIILPPEEELAQPVVADWIAGKAKLLSSKDGAYLFDPEKPGTDILGVPRVVTEPGRSSKLEVGQRVPLSGKEQPEYASTGIVFESQAWPTAEAEVLKVNLTGFVTEVTGYQADATGFDVPQLKRQEGKYQGDLRNGSYLLISQTKRPLDSRTKVPLLGDVPLLGRMFRSTKTSFQDRLIAARIQFTAGQ